MDQNFLFIPEIAYFSVDLGILGIMEGLEFFLFLFQFLQFFGGLFVFLFQLLIKSILLRIQSSDLLIEAFFRITYLFIRLCDRSIQFFDLFLFLCNELIKFFYAQGLVVFFIVILFPAKKIHWKPPNSHYTKIISKMVLKENPMKIFIIAFLKHNC